MKNKTNLWRPLTIGRRYVSKKHTCGNGFYGAVIKSHGIMFCGMCGFEFE